VPQADLDRHGLGPEDVLACRDSPAARALVRDLCDWARALMLEGAPLALTLPGRAGWELRFVVQGGLAILDKIAARGHDSFVHRPSLGLADLPRLAWGALTMRAAP
jgi:phytoene/squalene synthetase